MTIAKADREVKDLIQKNHVYGAEAIINALVRAAQTEPYLTPDAIKSMVDHAFERQEATK